MYFRPGPATHAAFFYGFIGVALAWQVVFLIVSRDPVRFRPVMLPAVLEKVSFGIPAILLYSKGKLELEFFAAGIVDLVLAVLFLVSWKRTRG